MSWHGNQQRAEREKTEALKSRVFHVIQSPRAREEVMATGRLSLAGFSRATRTRAAGSASTIAKAGYDPYGASRFLVSLGRSTQLRAIARRPGARRHAGYHVDPSLNTIICSNHHRPADEHTRHQQSGTYPMTGSSQSNWSFFFFFFLCARLRVVLLGSCPKRPRPPTAHAETNARCRPR